MNLDPTDPADLARICRFYRYVMPVAAMRERLPPIVLALGTRTATDLIDVYEQAARDEAAFNRWIDSLNFPEDDQ